MTRIALTSGAYQARSVVSAAQRSLNLYPEPMPQAQGEPMPMAHYPTPGTWLAGTVGPGPIRGIHRTTWGFVYLVSGSEVHQLNLANFTGTHLGDITPGLTTPVSMADNGIVLVIVDGSANGWTVDENTNTFARISDPSGAFVGADKVDYLDTFFLFNKRDTPLFYWSLSNSIAFDPLDFADKESFPDLLVTLVVARREVYLLGTKTTEVWFHSGLTDASGAGSEFSPVQGVFIDHGIVAKYSAAEYDNGIYWLSRNRQGQGVVVTSSGYRTERISTYAIETALPTYSRIDDAIGWVHQINGHAFYVLTFPAADKTWCYDTGTKLWHEWCWIDTNGAEHRHRANCFCSFNDILVVGDRQDGSLYVLDSGTYTDAHAAATGPIKRVRSFPHMVADGRRLFFREFLADFETGTAPKQGPVPDNLLVSLDWSDDRGHRYGNPVAQAIGGTSPALGAGGDYFTSLQWQRLGMTRDRVFRLSWTVNAPTVLQGAWITVEAADADTAPAPAAAEG